MFFIAQNHLHLINSTKDWGIMMNKLDNTNHVGSGIETTKELRGQETQGDNTVNTWDLLTDEQQQAILAHLTAMPFQ